VDESICPGCATSLPSSQLLYEGYFNTTPECWSLFTEVQGKQYGNVLLGRYTHQSTVDAYAAQHAGANHPDKSVAIHLLGLYLVIVQDVDPLEVAPKQQHIASRRANWPGLIRPENQGVLTIFDVAMSDDDDHIETVDAWAREVWAMWDRHHQTIAELL
jgi:hypothetical protein